MIDNLSKTLTAVGQDIKAIGVKIDNISVGGRNLLRNTQRPTATTPIHHNTTDNHRIDFIDVSYDGEVMTVVGTRATNRLSLSAWNATRLDLESNTDYVLSGYVKAQSDVELSIRWWKHTTRWISHVIKYHATTDWTKFVIKFGVPNEPLTGAFLELIINAPIDNAVSFKQIQLERGNVATDYTPAPEDAQSQIDALQAELLELKSKVNSSSGSIGD